MSSQEIDVLNQCPYEDEKIVHTCTEVHTYAFAFGLRQQCKGCRTYQKWRHDHKEELRRLKRERW